jgi:hypothetical protein
MRTKQSKLLITLGLALIITISLATQPAHAVVNKFKDDVGIGTTNPGASLEVVGDMISAGTEWTSRTSAANNQWESITYGNGMFVAVADSGTGNRVMTSSDGINWTTQTNSADYGWMSVTYGNGLFVAVAKDATSATNRVMTSPNGINWTGRNAATACAWTAVTYGNGLFVAVADTTGSPTYQVMTSPDGINWTSRSAAEANDWMGITYGDGLFVAVANNGSNQVMTSSDGITWSEQIAAAGNTWLSVTYGNGLFVAVSSSGTGDRVMTSSNGTSWASQTSAADNDWFSVKYGNGLFVAVAYSGTGNRVMTSPDGINWQTRASAANNGWMSVTYGNGLFVAVSDDGSGNRVMTSGRTKFNPVPTKNIYQGGMSIYGNVGIGNTVPSTVALWVEGTCAGGSSCDADLAEIFPKLADEMFEPGDVVVLSGTDRFNLSKSQEPFDTRVAGIYSTDPGMLIRGRGGMSLAPGGKDELKFSDTEVPLALAGRVLVKVTNENGAIKKGDFLTTSSTPGHAMKCPMETAEDKLKARGTVLGKALESFDGEVGKIEALVGLQ